MRKIAIVFSLFCLVLGVFDTPNFARIKQTGFGDIDVSIQTDKQKIKDNLNNIKNIGANSKIAGGRTLDSLSDLASSVRENKADLIGTIDDYQDAIARREAFSQLTAEELDLIQNPEKYDIESQKYVADKFNHIYSEMRGLDHADAQFFDDEKLENEQGKGTKASETTAFYDPDKNDIYFEADKIQDDNKMAHALGHESKRQDLNQKNSQELDQTTIAFDAGKHSKQAFERELKYKDVQIEPKQNYVRSSEDNDAIKQGSNNASKVENVQPWIESAWDAANVGMGVASGVENLKEGNYKDAIIDGVGVAADSAALLLPAIPAGAGTAIQTARKTEKLTALKKKQEQIKLNSQKGNKREKIVQSELEKEFGEGNVLQQRTILDKDGKKLKDPKTGSGRRLDHLVLDDKGNAIKRVETTSLTAPKYEQLEKEKRILRSDDAFVKHPKNDKLIKINDSVLEVRRLE